MDPSSHSDLLMFFVVREFFPPQIFQPRCTWKDWASSLCRWTRPPNGIISSAWLLLLLISLYFPFKASRVAFSEQSRLEWIWWRPAVVVSSDDGCYFWTWDLFLGLFAGILHWAGYWMSLALKIEEARTKMLDVLCRWGGLPNFKCILVLKTRHRLLLKAVTLVRWGAVNHEQFPSLRKFYSLKHWTLWVGHCWADDLSKIHILWRFQGHCSSVPDSHRKAAE